MTKGWEEFRLKQICSLITDGKHGDCRNEDKSGYYFLSAKDVLNGKLLYENSRQIAKEDFEETHKRTNLQPGDILLTNSGTIGRLAIASNDEKTQKTTFQKSVAVLKPVPSKILSGFLYYSLLGNNRFLVDLAGGTTQQNLLLGDLKEFPVRIPDLDEQQKILSVLKSFDEKIDLLHQQNQTLESIAGVLWREWFIEAADLKWPLKKISDIVDVRDGTHDSPKQSETGFYLITSRHLKDGQIDYQNAYRISEEDYHSVNKRSKVDKDDILFSMIGTLGLIHYVYEEPDFAIKNIGLFKSSRKPEFAKYLYLLIKSSIGRDFIYENADGSTQEYISLGNLRSFSLQYPGDKVISEFNNVISPYFDKIFHNKKHIRSLEFIRDSLLPKLMKGEIKLKKDY